MSRAAVLTLVASAVACLAPVAAAQDLKATLAQIADQAAVFRRIAPKVVAEETLTQRALKPSAGAQARSEETREIVSEYSFGTLGTPASLHEFRKVISVDGNPVTSRAAARHSLALGLSSPDDDTRKRLLEEFQKYGLANAVVDFGPLLLLFSGPRQAEYQFQTAGEERIGADAVQVISYKQVSGQGRMLVFAGRRAVHQAVEGRIYARASDGLVLRITLVESRAAGKAKIRDEATVDYTPNAHGFLAPASVTHREFAGQELLVEDEFRYSVFREFGSDAAIKFDLKP